MKLKFSTIVSSLLMASIFATSGLVSSCNKAADDSSESFYVPSSTVAVTNFYIKGKNSSITVDSVFFSIDLNNAVIFNADSLPVGSDVTKLVPVISYTSSVSAVKLTVNKDGETVEYDYLDSPSDSIDFSNPVKLTITAEDLTTVRSYQIKVNVHTVEPDSLVWDRLAVTPLPSRFGEPQKQKTVKFNNSTYSLIQEKDESYTLAVATDILAGEWTLKTPVLDFLPNVNSLCALPDCLCILDTGGVLHTSSDGVNWSSIGNVWANIIGAYGNVLLGIRTDNGVLVHTSWPANAGFPEEKVAEDFPIADYSDFVLFSNRWTTLPIGFMTGGRLADGSLTEKTWGFDGDHWEVLSENMMPQIEGATIVPYFVYRKTSSSLVQTEFAVWMLIGGALNDGSMNRTVYVSYDNGVNWYAADTQMQLPDYFPGLKNLDGIMVEWPKQASLDANWQTKVPRPVSSMARLNYEVNDYEVYWDCPYIYIFGGETTSGLLNDEVWRGVLNRLTFMPQF